MARRIRSSRLSRYSEKQNRKQFLLFGIGTLVILFLLFQFAGFFLNLFGTVIFGIRGEDETANSETQINEVILSPNLLNLPAATPSAEIDIEGKASSGDGEIILFVNGREVDTQGLDGKRDFEFMGVNLHDGENIIKAKQKIDDNESDFSEDYIVIRSSDEPKLEISNPSNDAAFKKADKRINVSGKTDPNNEVTVNTFRAVVDSEGNFSYLLELNQGENIITIDAINEAGVKVSQQRKVTYQSE